MRTLAAIPFYCVLALLLVLMACSCNSVQKSTDYLKRKKALAEVCATAYPVHDSTYVVDSSRIDTFYVPTDPVVLKDSFYIKGDTVVKVITKQCPQTKTIVKTELHDSIIIRENTARVAALQIENDKGKTQLTKAQDKIEALSKWRLWCLITWVICALYIAGKIRRIIPF